MQEQEPYDTEQEQSCTTPCTDSLELLVNVSSWNIKKHIPKNRCKQLARRACRLLGFVARGGCSVYPISWLASNERAFFTQDTRTLVMQELYDTEKSYVESLDIIVNVSAMRGLTLLALLISRRVTSLNAARTCYCVTVSAVIAVYWLLAAIR